MASQTRVLVAVGVVCSFLLGTRTSEADDATDAAQSASPPSDTNAYFSEGFRTTFPTAHAVDGVGSGWAFGADFGWKRENLRLGGGLDAGGATACAACSPLSFQWLTAAVGLRGGYDVLRFGRWGLSTILGMAFTLAGNTTENTPVRAIFRPNAHLALWMMLGRPDVVRLEIDLGLEEWITLDDRSPAVGIRVALSTLLGL
jgi:hypothetical protein